MNWYSPETVEKHPFKNPYFLGILALKLVIGTFVGSHFIRDLFVPFVQYYAMHPFSNPWDAFMELGRLKAFPYHAGMLAFLAPVRMLFFWLPDPGWEVATFADFFSIRVSLLLADVAIYWVLVKWFAGKTRSLLLLYWASPLVIYISYFHGQLDVIPVAMLMLSLHFLRNGWMLRSAAMFGLGLGTKTTALLALPFFAVYTWRNLGKVAVVKWLGLAAAVAAALIIPLSSSPGYRTLVLGAEEQLWLFKIGYEVPIVGTSVYFAVFALAILLMRFLDYKKVNFDLTVMYAGLAMVVVVALVPPMPGWFMWLYPMVVYAAMLSPRRTGWNIVFLDAAFLAWFLMFAPTADLFSAMALLSPGMAGGGPPWWLLPQGLGDKLGGIVLTLLVASEFNLFYWLYRTGVKSNAVYAPPERPLLVGISGDSGTGKDTLCGMIRGVLGDGKVLQLDGDDYHRWERGAEGYEKYTHLNAVSNRLHTQMHDIFLLGSGLPIRKAFYDHSTGRFSEPGIVHPRQVVLVSGLHSLFVQGAYEKMHLKIFLDHEPELYHAWKVARDTGERGYRAEDVKRQIQDREADVQKFIRPQKKRTDVIFAYRFAEGKMLEDYRAAGDEALRLEIDSVNSIDWGEFFLAIESIPGVAISMEYLDEEPRLRLTISGMPTVLQISQAAFSIIPNLHEFTVPRPEWRAGLQGVQQLAAVMAISQALVANSALRPQVSEIGDVT
jgi:uridine kinase